MPVDSRNLIRAQSNTGNIRNICILAHVDHGKTSLSDALLATNGIISHTMQGQIRYLDSRPDEQIRGITMEASVISILSRIAQKPTEPDGAPIIEEYLINLIDSPGHIDFSSEVTTASRLCDGAVILVDAAEGVCSQTVTALKQSWDDQLKPILVINKIDRLIVEFQMTGPEAGSHLMKIVEQVNAVIGTFFTGKRMQQDLKWREAQESEEKQEYEDVSEEGIYFAPQNNNVVFASALDGWGFTISQFAAIYERKLGVKREKLEKFLWGEYYLDPKTKKVSRSSNPGKNQKTMFVQFILENILAIYGAVADGDDLKIEKIVKSLNLQLTPRETQQKDKKILLTVLFNKWIPVARAVIMSVTRCLPSPLEAQKVRTDLVLEHSPSAAHVSPNAITGMRECDPSGPIVSFISKVIQVPWADLSKDVLSMFESLRLSDHEVETEPETSPQNAKAKRDHAPEVIIGVARIYSGTIRTGDTVDLLGPAFSQGKGNQQQTIKVTGIFILMGREMIPIPQASAGTIVGISGLDGKIVKSGTLVEVGSEGPNLAVGSRTPKPILRVALETVNPVELPALEHGLDQLNVSDPSVATSISDQGEYILEVAGELHLERCLKDLRERFAKTDIECSEAIVPFRETIANSGDWKPNPDTTLKDRGYAEMTVGDIYLQIAVCPLPVDATALLCQGELGDGTNEWNQDQLKDQLIQIFKKTKSETWNTAVDRIISFGPNEFGPNLLIDDTRGILKQRAFTDSHRGQYDEGIVSGFQAAISKGPLMGEPVQGVAVFVKSIERTNEHRGTSNLLIQRRLISASRSLILSAMEQWSPRVRLATYLVDIQASTDVLGRVYGVVTRRRGRILTEELREGTPFFTVTASIPIVESFGFSDEIRKRTSGAANPQLVFDGFQTLDEDPYWVPTTEEEINLLGELSDKENVALKYVQAIRRRKGLRTNEKIVENSERQRNLKR